MAALVSTGGENAWLQGIKSTRPNAYNAFQNYLDLKTNESMGVVGYNPQDLINAENILKTQFPKTWEESGRGGTSLTSTPATSPQPVQTGGLIAQPNPSTQVTGSSSLATATSAPIASPSSVTANLAKPVAPITAVNAVQDQERGTVSGQISGLINANSTLMQRAAQSGLEMANSRGLLNSGMAIGSAQNAVYDYALPIASADAASNNQFGLINADTANLTNRFNTSNQQQTNLINADAANQASQFNAQQSNAIATENARIAADTARYNAQAQNQLVMQQLDQANRIQLADIQATYYNQMQANQDSANLFNSAMSALNNIQQSTTMDAPTKQKAVDDQVSMLKSALSLQGAIANLNLTSVLDFTV